MALPPHIIADMRETVARNLPWLRRVADGTEPGATAKDSREAQRLLAKIEATNAARATYSWAKG